MTHQEEASVVSFCVMCGLFYLCRILTRQRACFRTCQLHHTPCAVSLKNCTQSRAAFIRCVRGQEKEEVVFWGSVVYCFWKETVLPEIICTFDHLICTLSLPSLSLPLLTNLVRNPHSHQRSSIPQIAKYHSSARKPSPTKGTVRWRGPLFLSVGSLAIAAGLTIVCWRRSDIAQSTIWQRLSTFGTSS